MEIAAIPPAMPPAMAPAFDLCLPIGIGVAVCDVGVAEFEEGAPTIGVDVAVFEVELRRIETDGSGGPSITPEPTSVESPMAADTLGSQLSSFVTLKRAH
jgi:hypothetical protein